MLIELTQTSWIVEGSVTLNRRKFKASRLSELGLGHKKPAFFQKNRWLEAQNASVVCAFDFDNFH